MVGKGASYKEFGLESHLISPILIRVQGTDQHKMLSKHTAFARCAKRSRGIIPMRGDADERAAASRIFEAVLDFRAKGNGHFITRPNTDRGW